MTFSKKGQEKCDHFNTVDSLLEVTTFAGFTVFTI